MRLLFASVGSYGHVIPLLPLALAARDAGHAVTFATAKRGHAVLLDAGLDAIPVGPTVADAFAEVYAAGASKVSATAITFGSLLPRRTVADLLPLLRQEPPDLVVYGVLNPGAAIAARLAGVPAVCHGVGKVSGEPTWHAMCGTWLATAAELGVAAPARDPELLGNPFVDICPPSLRWRGFQPAVRLPMRPGRWSQPGSVPLVAYQRARGRPLVYLTFGTQFVKPGLYRQAVDGLAGLPVDVLVAAGSQAACDEIGAAPGNVTLQRWVPQDDVLPHVDLVVSHGGSGTVLGALANGLPQLLLPQRADQFSNARAVVEAGAGRQLLPGQLTPYAVAAQARALLEDESALLAAGLLAKEIAAQPAPGVVVERLISYDVCH
jgi:UDP:flavonoid glycosyltransferase YjiC (YdhE family)